MKYAGIGFSSLPHADHAVAGWYWTRNDISMNLTAIFFFFVLSSDSKVLSLKLKHLILLALVSIFIWINDATIIMVGVIMFVLGYALSLILKIFSVSLGAKVFVFIFIAAAIVFVVFVVMSSVDALHLLSPLVRLATLDAYDLPYGSITNRIDATIYSIKEFLGTFGFGIGLGNTLEMLSEKYGHLRSLMTVHNISIQLLAEMGFLFSVLLLVLAVKVGIAAVIFFWCPLVVVSISQSASIFSNYLFWCIVGSSFYVAMGDNFFGQG
jgi:hypothetical protein